MPTIVLYYTILYSWRGCVCSNCVLECWDGKKDDDDDDE